MNPYDLKRHGKHLDNISLITRIQNPKCNRERDSAFKLLLKKYDPFIWNMAKARANVLTFQDKKNLIIRAMFRAAELFDMNMGTPFIGYVKQWIRAYYAEELREAFLIKIPHDVHLELNRHIKATLPQYLIDELIQHYHDDYGITLLEETAKKILREDYRMTKEDNLIQMNQTTCLESTVGNKQGGEITFSDVIEQSTFENVVDKVILIDDNNIIMQAIKELPSVEMEVIARCFGFVKGLEAQSLREVGHDMKYSHERVRQLRDKALKSLKSKLMNTEVAIPV